MYNHSDKITRFIEPKGDDRMLQKLGNRLKKDQKGMTLIELLAVIVILGIIAAIAVPSILGIIKHSKQDAQIANAQEIANAAKVYIADTKVVVDTTAQDIPLNTLVTNGYLEDLKDPNGTTYSTDSKIVVKKVSDKNIFDILLKNSDSSKTYIDTTSNDSKDVSNLARTDVTQ
jgi:type IV pilus assembly protein PilA